MAELNFTASEVATPKPATIGTVRPAVIALPIAVKFCPLNLAIIPLNDAMASFVFSATRISIASATVLRLDIFNEKWHVGAQVPETHFRQPKFCPYYWGIC
jgi:hypothetical protein